MAPKSLWTTARPLVLDELEARASDLASAHGRDVIAPGEPIQKMELILRHLAQRLSKTNASASFLSSPSTRKTSKWLW
ncbi:hypothetical protein N7539_001047 [Penicillium diatomitis]|uniref:Uncharacterized protein n=1 Tax=Penicillium diatomitis TaxID=2819901 RepID=A0A9W9XMX8_9EURO|nr:uncharacterized protein N7539_001047 [Penicillium diatomitis]KAJ5495931.1 hypothetical protein N7539_001047 [Penicillium diatomitis]